MTSKKYGAGILVYRWRESRVEVFVVHPGGPFWVKKDNWGIPKGDQRDGEDLVEVAKREFAEEIGSPAPEGELADLGEVKRSDGRMVKAWAVEGDLDAGAIRSNQASIEWPPKSGVQIQVPEVDKAKWMTLAEAAQKAHAYQKPLIARLAEILKVSLEAPAKPSPHKLSNKKVLGGRQPALF